jgi:hypothetical protein
MISVFLNDKKYEMPACWEDLTPDTSLAVMSLIYSGVPDYALKIRLLRLIFPIKNGLLKKLDAEQVLKLIRLTHWVWNLPTAAHFTFQFFEHRGVRYITPEANFENGTYAEFVAANIHFLKFSNEAAPDYAALDELVATLCRPATKKDTTDPETWNGDEREVFNSEICRKRALAFGDLPVGIKIATAHYWVRFLEGLSQKYPAIFEQGDGGKSDGGLGWVNTLFSVAEDGALGTVKDVERTFFHKVCLYLNKKKKDFDAANKD